MPNLDAVLAAIADDVNVLLQAPAVPLGVAEPPSTPGVYMLLVDDALVYVGEAKGRGGLRDRLKYKHVSGDEGHAGQRALAEMFPDRLTRRAHILANVHARWLAIPDLGRVSAVERVLLCLYRPPWNRA